MLDTFKALTSPTALSLHHSTDENTEAGRGEGTNLAELQSPGPHSRIMPRTVLLCALLIPHPPTPHPTPPQALQNRRARLLVNPLLLGTEVTRRGSLF